MLDKFRSWWRYRRLAKRMKALENAYPNPTPEQKKLMDAVVVEMIAILLKKEERPCPSCGKLIIAQATECIHCGQAVPTSSSSVAR